MEESSTQRTLFTHSVAIFLCYCVQLPFNCMVDTFHCCLLFIPLNPVEWFSRVLVFVRHFVGKHFIRTGSHAPCGVLTGVKLPVRFMWYDWWVSTNLNSYATKACISHWYIRNYDFDDCQPEKKTTTAITIVWKMVEMS